MENENNIDYLQLKLKRLMRLHLILSVLSVVGAMVVGITTGLYLDNPAMSITSIVVYVAIMHRLQQIVSCKMLYIRCSIRGVLYDTRIKATLREDINIV